MKKAIFLIIGIVMFLTAKVYAYDKGDFQIWNIDVEEFKVGKGCKIAFEEEFRWGNNAREFYYQHYEAGFFYDLFKCLNIGGGYRQVYDLIAGKFKSGNEPFVSATLLLDREGFNFEDRSRMEYRNFDYKHDSWRYRNKATLRFPWKFTKMEIRPYLSDEIFVVFGGVPSDLNQNRFCLGLSMNFTKNLKAEIYYMLHNTKSSKKWTYSNVLGTKFKIAF